MAVAMKPRTRLSFWLVGGSLFLSLSWTVALNSQALLGQDLAAASSSAGITGPRSLNEGGRQVGGPASSDVRCVTAATAPLSKKIPVRTMGRQRAATCLASEASVSIGCGASYRLLAGSHPHTHAVCPFSVLSLQAQHVRIQV
jgi:hypothetical protein